MKKLFYFCTLLSAMMLTACGSNKQETTENEEDQVTLGTSVAETDETEDVQAQTGATEQMEAQTGATEQVQVPQAASQKQAVKLRTQNDSINYLLGFNTGFDMRAGGDEITEQTVADFISVLDAGYKGKEVKAESYPKLNSQWAEAAQNIGRMIREQERQSGLMGIKGLNTNIKLIEQGFADGMMGDESRFTRQAAFTYLETTLTPLAQAQQEAAAKELKKDGEQYLAKNAKRAGVKTTASGLQYEVLKQGDGPKPTAESTVKVHYEGSLIDGTVFDSSYQRGEPIEFPLNRVIAGWTEGLQLMPVGSTYMLYIPYNLGYGEYGAGGSIPPYAALVFKVELLEIK